ncbi:TrbC/VirB2 family protein [Rubricoccus marinus]|uniref:Conjugal transfer protein TrbC n=1 Tax=Rubricoccus marinus TaxID=716817 RepID=A0A259TTV5_9BACT|nr:TrbC/VirB2 family protein [Rubricoccus marinus]OZC01159.1 hypothetical protein BSZ36_18760 [Rubricoccus marinus]
MTRHPLHIVRKPTGPPRPRRLPTLALRAAGLCALALVLADPAAASGGAAMPWDGPLQTIADALTGNTIRLVAVIALAAGGIIWAFTRNEEGVKRIAQAVMGLGVAIGAASFAATLGISGATL